MLFRSGLWLQNAARANEMARRLVGQVEGIDGVKVSRTPEVNSVFATLPRSALAPLQAWSHFYVWDESTTEVRWMTSFDTTADDVDRFAAGVVSLVDEHARL